MLPNAFILVNEAVANVNDAFGVPRDIRFVSN